MRSPSYILAVEHAEGAQSDNRNAECENRGLMTLKSCSFSSWLGGWLERKDAWGLGKGVGKARLRILDSGEISLAHHTRSKRVRQAAKGGGT
jgi:hypothetical protein